MLGFIGLPVFTGFSGGAAKIMGPTGGYIIGYFFLTLVSTLVIDEKAKYFCIAILSNRIAYWYWTAIGDGFHFNAAIEVVKEAA